MNDCEQFLNGHTPLDVFSQWVNEAKTLSLREPMAMVLSTIGKDQFPHSRVVLLKEIRIEGIVFYTNYQSQKGLDLAKNPNAAINFYWDPILRQVKLQGTVKKLSRSDSEKYWRKRERTSQISQWVSQQSQPVESRGLLDQLWQDADKKLVGRDVPCPKHWGGYVFNPTYIEFWIGREGRFHDRFAFKKAKSKWQGNRLFP